MVGDLGWVDFDSDVPSSCPAAQPVLPNPHWPQQNRADIGTRDESGIPASRYFGSARVRLRLPVDHGHAELLQHELAHGHLLL